MQLTDVEGQKNVENCHDWTQESHSQGLQPEIDDFNFPPLFDVPVDRQWETSSLVPTLSAFTRFADVWLHPLSGKRAKWSLKACSAQKDLMYHRKPECQSEQELQR